MFIRHRHADCPLIWSHQGIRNEKRLWLSGPPHLHSLLCFPCGEMVTMLHKYSDRWQPTPVLRIRRLHYYSALAVACLLWALLILAVRLLLVLRVF
jgi:hypothetical protein